MVKKMKNYVQKGEVDFINNVVTAVLNNDVSREHYLIDEKGIMRYVSYKAESTIFDLRYENGERVKVVCIFGRELIETIHSKAGNDDLTKPWIKKAVISIIAHGKQVSDKVYI